MHFLFSATGAGFSCFRKPAPVALRDGPAQFLLCVLILQKRKRALVVIRTSAPLTKFCWSNHCPTPAGWELSLLFVIYSPVYPVSALFVFYFCFIFRFPFLSFSVFCFLFHPGSLNCLQIRELFIFKIRWTFSKSMNFFQIWWTFFKIRWTFF